MPRQPKGMTEPGLKVCAAFEGWAPRPYNDPVGYCTVYFGELIGLRRCQPQDFRNFPPISEAEGRERLRRDMDGNYVQPMLKLIEAPVDQGIVNGLGCFVYNVGLGAFGSSTLLRLLNEKKYEAAFAQLDRWVYAGGRVFLGLQRRRDAEQELWMSDGSVTADWMPKLTGEQARLLGFAEKATTANALTIASDRLKRQIEKTKDLKYRSPRTDRAAFNRRLEILRRELRQARDKLEDGTYV